MKRAIACLGLMILTGCGVDGEPIPPGSEEDEAVARNDPTVPRPRINGALSVGSNGTRASVGTEIISGNVTIGMGTTF